MSITERYINKSKEAFNRIPKFEIGQPVKFRITQDHKKKFECIEGKVDRIDKNCITVQTENYKTCINVVDLVTGYARLVI